MVSGSLSYDAESQVESHILAKLLIKLLHAGSYDDQYVGDMRVPIVYKLNGPLVWLILLYFRSLGIEGMSVVRIFLFIQVILLYLKYV